MRRALLAGTIERNMAQKNVNRQTSKKEQDTEEHPEAKRELEEWVGVWGRKRTKRCV
jgi:hypothetical protein